MMWGWTIHLNYLSVLTGSPRGSYASQMLPLSPVGSFALVPAVSTASKEMWFVRFECDRRKVHPVTTHLFLSPYPDEGKGNFTNWTLKPLLTDCLICTLTSSLSDSVILPPTSPLAEIPSSWWISRANYVALSRNGVNWISVHVPALTREQNSVMKTQNDCNSYRLKFYSLSTANS